ncbi:enoyl-CoA hydratase/isomerase family protein [Uniformispora flossi]|uniref:enoyl-CoA hydratase/isomerase family protein n=1 Tax=Uniformispora flossi TaxID=3390723 RepID=UPI003C3017C8
MESPFLAVDLDRPDALAGADVLWGREDRVVVGIAAEPRDPAALPGGAEACDVLLTGPSDAPRPWVGRGDPHAAAARLAAVVDSQPAASLALVQVLRMGSVLTGADRIAAESLAYSMLLSGAGFRAWRESAPARTPRPVAEPVLVRREGDALHVTLDRPQARNAMDAGTRDALCEAFRIAVADPSVAEVHLRGNGPAFCSGGDLAEFGTSADPARAHLIRVHRSPGAQLQRCGPRVTAYLHGACVGAGIELPAFAGRVVAASDTAIRLPEIAMGLIPGAGGTASIPPRIGRHRTAWLALTGDTLTAERALAWGLVDALAASAG